MIQSMTGYGRARETINRRDITVELRSVNNRYLDCTVKMPRMYIFAEDAIKTAVQQSVSRGKVDVFITIDATEAEQGVVSVNLPLAAGYLEAIRQISGQLGLPEDITARELSRFPDVITVTKAEEDLESLSADICTVLRAAIENYGNTIFCTECLCGFLSENGTRLCGELKYFHCNLNLFCVTKNQDASQFPITRGC